MVVVPRQAQCGPLGVIPSPPGPTTITGSCRRVPDLELLRPPPGKQRHLPVSKERLKILKAAHVDVTGRVKVPGVQVSLRKEPHRTGDRLRTLRLLRRQHRPLRRPPEQAPSG